ncbi:MULTISPECIES: tetratricopeptide repeat protein [Pseudomonadota]|jgi:cytochrome c-type biogenesis protein CcmH|uniref:tetratricopeptide repeat protein n=1 Tax=Pseudomonadota TaxID=1224 RepID=UPI00076A1C4B|nr:MULTISPECIES: tetratricopeptide repeat protein [Pseudomonadota]|tara:strand:- start:26666 stop:27682 length:1017 start_codon:yes stop_codon:yes gene_type:complete
MTDQQTDTDMPLAAEPASARASGGRPGVGTIALAAAALIAVTAVGYKVYSDQKPAASGPVAPLNAQGQPASVDEVITQLEARLRENPNDAEGWRMLGWSYFETQRFAESATAMRRAIQLAPGNSEYHSMLGEALVMASKDEAISQDARTAFKRAVELDPKDARARYFLAAAKDIDGKHAEAIEDWFALLAETPADAPYAKDIRDVIRNVGKERGIDVEKRLASAKFAPPTAGFRTDGAETATAGIPGPTPDQMAAAAALPQGQQDMMIQQMVDGLAERLKREPGDTDGWIMLLRSRMQLGETGKAQAALRDATAALKNKAADQRKVREAAAALGVPGA